MVFRTTRVAAKFRAQKCAASPGDGCPAGAGAEHSHPLRPWRIGPTFGAAALQGLATAGAGSRWIVERRLHPGQSSRLRIYYVGTESGRPFATLRMS